MTAWSLTPNVRGHGFQMHHYRGCAGDPLSRGGRAAFFAYLSLRRFALLGADIVDSLRSSTHSRYNLIVGRMVPVVGEIFLAIDAIQIMRHSLTTYNRLAKPEDRLL
jgi:hypothetical protein